MTKWQILSSTVFFFLSPSEFHNMQSFLFFAFVLFCVVLCLLPKHPLYTDYRFSINFTPIYTTGLK